MSFTPARLLESRWAISSRGPSIVEGLSAAAPRGVTTPAEYAAPGSEQAPCHGLFKG